MSKLALICIALLCAALGATCKGASPSHEPAEQAGPEAPEAADPSVTAVTPASVPQEQPPATEAEERAAPIRAALEAGDREGARSLLHQAVGSLEEPLAGAEQAQIAELLVLDQLAEELGSLNDSATLREVILACRERLYPVDHPDVLAAKQHLAVSRKTIGDFAGALELEEELLAARTRLLPPEHHDLLATKLNLAKTRKSLGELAAAGALEEEVVEVWTRLLPPDHRDLLTAKSNLAVTRSALGDLAGARELQEQVLEARARLLPADHPELSWAKQNLAATRYKLGDLAGARELLEQVLATQTRRLPEDHPDLLAAKLNSAVIRLEFGDLTGARELFEEAHAAQERILPPDHPDLLAGMQNLAGMRKALGDLAGALDLEEAVLEARTRRLSQDHPDLLTAQQNVAVTRKELGDLAGARELEEEVLAACLRILPTDHPLVLTAKQNLAVTLLELGDFSGASDLLEEALAGWSPLLAEDHPDLLRVEENLAATRRAQGDPAGAREMVSSVLAGQRERARALSSDSPRAAREQARLEIHRLFGMLSSSSAAGEMDRDLAPELFAALESLRNISVASPEVALAVAKHPELTEIQRAIEQERSLLNDLVATGPAETQAVEKWRAEVVRVATVRDGLERELRTELEQVGAFVREVDARAVAAALEPGALAISYLRYPNGQRRDSEAGGAPPATDSLLAFVVRPDGAVRRIELGPADELEALALEWRASIGKPIERGGGVASAQPSADAVGRALRERLIDPLLAPTGGDTPTTLHVVLDDLLFLLPLDALPWSGEELAGEHLRILVESSFGRLVSPPRARNEGGTLVALGGVDFDAGLEERGSEHLAEAATPPLERSGMPEHFEPLRQTRYEVEDVSAQFEEAFGVEPVLLLGAAASKAELAARASSARWLHLATHAWFAPEVFRSELDLEEDPARRAVFLRAEETVRGFAPETLCGLALAGANRGYDELRRVPGILTAEELGSLDLSRCELAVLSACETNVGIRRAGQGIQSLQAALHGAGVRTAITSLWKVDDAATRRLMELLYSKLWKEKLGKREALWQAKMALRAEGHPVRDWAAWVLSGDPD